MAATPTVVFTDGACLGNPGPGGWAWAVPGGAYASGPEPQTTNQRMEIRAALEAARSLWDTGPIEVVSDSTYVVNCFRDRWWEGWVARGWTNKARKPVANRDLWEPLIDLYRSKPGHLRFRWVKGHSADAMNDLVDRLAVEAARTQHARSGDAPPTEVGAPDSVGVATGAAGAASAAAASVDSRVPDGWKVAISGVRWYEADLLTPALRSKVAEILAAKRELHPDLVVLTGLGLGAEQLAAEAALEASVPYVAVLAFPNPESVWPPPSQERYRRLLAGAVDVIVLQNKPPESKQKAGAALSRRDAWLARHADEAIVVWDGQDEWVGRLVRSFQDHLGEEEVWVVAP
ncbi:MAG TPA: RNase H family protein [Acidimicrobiales bacterium]|nr:RNase H family protein [Acidimicrobiales bacterium]